jgi:hypothetical protein
MARVIKDTPVITDNRDIERLLESVEKPQKVSKEEYEKRKKNYEYLESIKTFK